MAYKRIETDNPILDEIIYNCKKIITSLIIKDETKANKLETKDSIANFDIYHAIITGSIELYYFDITLEDLVRAFPDEKAKVLNTYLGNIRSLPPLRRKQLLESKVNHFLANYEEMNDYYRLITGNPPYGEKGIYLRKSQVKDLPVSVNTANPIHKMSDIEKHALITGGIIKELIEKYPECEYLKYFDKEIDSYKARLAPKYDILYLDSSVNTTISDKYYELYDTNRRYKVATEDFDVYKYYSPLFERFLMMDIALSAMNDMIISFSDFFITREVFDIRTAEYFFESFGVDFFPEIPLKYQKRIIRAMNKLIMYKSTDKNIYDISKIFGFNNIEVFKYYLYKKQIQSTDKGIGYIVPDPDDYEHREVVVPGYKDEYELKFIKVPFREMVNDYLKDDTMVYDYEQIIGQDPYWNAGSTPGEVKDEILSRDFNIINTKYISISAMYNLTQASFEVTYFMNMLLYYGLDPRRLEIRLPGIDTRNDKFTLFEVIVYIQALTAMYTGAKWDDIITEPDQLAGIDGFDIYADLTQISSDIFTALELRIENECVLDGYTSETFLNSIETGKYNDVQFHRPYSEEYYRIITNVIKKFKTFSKDHAPTVSQLVEAYRTNKEVYDFIVYRMHNCDDIDTYKVYKKLYDTLMVIKVNNDLFMIDAPDGRRVCKTYREYIEVNNKRLYRNLLEIEAMKKGGDNTAFTQACFEAMSNACTAVTNTLNEEILSDVLYDIPSETANSVKSWLEKIIRFFMSHKLYILDTQTIYLMDPEYNRLRDDNITNVLYYPRDYMNCHDSTTSITSCIKFEPDNMRVRDSVEVNEYYEKEGGL